MSMPQAVACKYSKWKYKMAVAFVRQLFCISGGEKMYHIAICDDNEEFLDVIIEAIKQNSEYEPDLTFHKFKNGRCF